MILKPHIAILVVLVFCGKLLMMDSNVLVILGGNEIAHVNPLCKKQKAKIAGSALESFSEDSNGLNFTIDTFCNAPFKFEIFNWEYKPALEETRAYAYHPLNLPESPQDRIYPPPKV